MIKIQNIKFFILILLIVNVPFAAMNQSLAKSTHTFGGKITPSPLDLLKVSADVDRQTPHHHILTSMCNNSTTMSEDSDMASSLQSPSNHHIQIQSPVGHHHATSSGPSSLLSTGSQLTSMIAVENKLKPSPIPNNGIPQNLMLQHVAAAFQNSGTRHPPPVVPSVYEMAALTQDLDTQTITTKIKEALLANNIGQKVNLENKTSINRKSRYNFVSFFFSRFSEKPYWDFLKGRSANYFRNPSHGTC